MTFVRAHRWQIAALVVAVAVTIVKRKPMSVADGGESGKVPADQAAERESVGV